MKSLTLKRLAAAVPLALLATGAALPAAAEPAQTSTYQAMGAATSVGHGTLTPVDTGKLSGKYLQQKVAWSEENCSEADRNRRKDPAFAEIAYRKVECARITVPLNYLEPDRHSLELYALRVRAAMSDGEQGRPLFVNRGGPGGTASDYAMQVADRLPALSETHDVIGIDPRGIGQSSPIDCVTKNYDPDNYRPTALVDQGTDWSCVIKYRQAAFLGTENVARDFDLVRHLLGDSSIDYYGASYGTTVGRTYQSLFPTRSGRFVLDSNTAVRGAKPVEDVGFERRKEQLMAWLSRHNDKYALGLDRGSVEESYAAILEAASGGRLPGLTGDDIDSAWKRASYSDTSFALFAEGLADAKRYLANDRNTTLIQVRDKLFSWAAQGDIHTFYKDGAGGIMVLLADQGELAVNTDWTLPQVFVDWAQNKPTGNSYETALKSIANLSKAEPFGTGELRKVPGASDITNNANFPFVLMLQAEYDPATTWEEGLATLEQLPNSRLVAIEGSGTHGVFRGNNPCSDVVAYRYLQRGERPANHIVCAGVPIPGDKKVYPGPMIAKWQNEKKAVSAPVVLSPQQGATVKPSTEVTGELRGPEGNSTADGQAISVVVDGQHAQTVKLAADGKWRATLPQNLAVGKHKLTASVTDSDSGQVVESNPVEFTIEAADASVLQIKQTFAPESPAGQNTVMTVSFSVPTGMPVSTATEQRFVAPTGFRFTGVATHVLDGGQGSQLRTRVEEDGRVLIVLDPINLNVDGTNQSSADHRTVEVKVSSELEHAGTHTDGTVTVGAASPAPLTGTIQKQAQPRG